MCYVMLCYVMLCYVMLGVTTILSSARSFSVHKSKFCCLLRINFDKPKALPYVKLVNQPYQPITRRQILDSSKLKEFVDDNFKFDENDRKLSKRVKHTVGKGEIARYEQFLLFQQCFQKAFSQGRQKVSL